MPESTFLELLVLCLIAAQEPIHMLSRHFIAFFISSPFKLSLSFHFHL